MKRNKDMRRYANILCAVATMCVWGCGNKIPDDIIQPAAMENLLYDYHIASTMGNELPYQENYKKNAYSAYVFKKHQVTEAEFDSSMVWYSRHGDELSAIYDNLKKRLETDSERMKQLAARQTGEIAVSMSGDTVDIWQDRPLCWLTSSPYTNKILFELKADTSFKPKDMLTFEAEFTFLPRKQKTGDAVIGLKVTFDNDSVQGLTRVISSSGRQRLFLRPDSAFEYKNISGFVYYTGKAGEKGNLLLNDIRLVRTRLKTADRLLERPVSLSDSTKKSAPRPLIRH